MKSSLKNLYSTIFLALLLIPGINYAQDVKLKKGFTDSVASKILNETRGLLIHLPENYYSSDKSYDVLYQLDGSPDLLRSSISTIERLSYKEKLIPELIVIQIVSNYRDRDMWPVNTKYYPEPNPPGAHDFLEFIEAELIPYIEDKFRTSQNRIICGQSLSGVFTLYTFLSRPHLFDSYIVCSGAFPDCEGYFTELADKAFQQTGNYTDKKIYITHGLKDPLDRDGIIQQQMIDFSQSVNSKMNTTVSCRLQIYENGGHVPKKSLYDGLKYVYDSY